MGPPIRHLSRTLPGREARSKLLITSGEQGADSLPPR